MIQITKDPMLNPKFPSYKFLSRMNHLEIGYFFFPTQFSEIAFRIAKFFSHNVSPQTNYSS